MTHFAHFMHPSLPRLCGSLYIPSDVYFSHFKMCLDIFVHFIWRKCFLSIPDVWLLEWKCVSFYNESQKVHYFDWTTLVEMSNPTNLFLHSSVCESPYGWIWGFSFIVLGSIINLFFWTYHVLALLSKGQRPYEDGEHMWNFKRDHCGALLQIGCHKGDAAPFMERLPCWVWWIRKHSFP